MAFGALTWLLLVQPRVLQGWYARLANRFPGVAALDPSRRLMLGHGAVWVFRLMGMVSLVVWALLLALCVCWLVQA